MKILFVHEVSWSNKVVYEMHDFPELLSLRGHDVHFLDFDEGRPRARWKPICTVESRAHAGSAVHVTTGPRFLPGILGRLLATVVQPLLFVYLIRKIRPDVVVTYSIPTSGWQITSISNRFGIPVVARVIDVSHALRKTIFRKLVKRSEQFIYEHATFVSTHNQVLLDYCRELGARSAGSSVTFPGIDTVRFSPGSRLDNLRSRLGLSTDDKVLLFMGTLFRFSGLFELLNSLTHPLRKDPKLKFLILGDGEDLTRLQAFVQSSKLEGQVLFTGRIEYSELAEYLRMGDVAVLPFHQELVTHAALPAKVIQYLASGLPTISTRLDGLQSVIGADNGVIFVSTLEEMAEQALRLVLDDTRRHQLSQHGRNFVLKHFDWSNQIEAFEQILLAVQRPVLS